MRRILIAALASAVLGLVSLPSPAGAATLITGAGVCNQTSTTLPASSSGNYSACVGYSGNLLNEHRIADINAALDALVGGNYTLDVAWSALNRPKSHIGQRC